MKTDLDAGQIIAVAREQRNPCIAEDRGGPPEWCYLGTLAFASGYGSNQVRQYAQSAALHLRKYAQPMPALPAWSIGKFGSDDRTAPRPLHVLPVIRPNHPKIALPGGADFIDADNPSDCPIPGKGGAARVLVFAGSATMCDARTLASVEQAGRYVGPLYLNQASVALFARETGYEFGFAWIDAECRGGCDHG